MAEPFARRGDQRVLVSAISQLNNGDTPDEALSALMKRFGWLDGATAIFYVNRAQQALAKGRELTEVINRSVEGETEGIGVIIDGGAEVVVPVTITPPGQGSYVRQIRVRITPGMTDVDLRQEVESVIDKWLNRYGNEQTEVTWEVNYVLPRSV